jgi:hypothetical protein
MDYETWEEIYYPYHLNPSLLTVVNGCFTFAGTTPPGMESCGGATELPCARYSSRISALAWTTKTIPKELPFTT